MEVGVGQGDSRQMSWAATSLKAVRMRVKRRGRRKGRSVAYDGAVVIMLPLGEVLLEGGPPLWLSPQWRRFGAFGCRPSAAALVTRRMQTCQSTAEEPKLVYGSNLTGSYYTDIDGRYHALSRRAASYRQSFTYNLPRATQSSLAKTWPAPVGTTRE